MTMMMMMMVMMITCHSQLNGIREATDNRQYVMEYISFEISPKGVYK